MEASKLAQDYAEKVKAQRKQQISQSKLSAAPSSQRVGSARSKAVASAAALGSLRQKQELKKQLE